MAEALTRDDVLTLLVNRLAMVLARPSDDITADSRLDEDLQADSLDLVEVVERVESDLAAHGLMVNLPEEELLLLRTVGDAADRLHARAAGTGG